MAKFLFQAIVLASLGFISLSYVIDTRDHNWNYFVYSQWWPQSQCYYKHLTSDPNWRINNVKFTNSCVPEGVDAWTIHGLWPTINGTPDPAYCNRSLPFDKSQIENLRSKLMTQWLSFPDTSESNAAHLWSHEWEKHGTCAVSLPSLNTEYKYFFKALELNLQYNPLTSLKSVNIVPSDTQQYDIEDIENGIMKVYGKKGRVICLIGPDGLSYLAGIRICLSKDFSTIDCIVTEPEKCRGDTVVYPTIMHDYE